MRKHSEGGVAGAPARAAETRVITDGAAESVPLEEAEAAASKGPARRGHAAEGRAPRPAATES